VKTIALDQMAQAEMMRVLTETHREIEEHLARITALAGGLSRQPADEAVQRQLSELLAFFAGPLRRHDIEEERHLFPALLRDGDPELHRRVERLREDHAWIELRWLDIEPQLAAVAKGGVADDLSGLQDAVHDFVDVTRDHMAVEESLLDPLLRGRSLSGHAT
jgi:iron-sulfur cluster repair protein YtfE (RIC family)